MLHRQYTAPGHWGFPKGHQDAVESEKETAIRELKEETGIDAVNLLEDKTFTEHYSFLKDSFQYNKSVKYFIGFVPSMTVVTPENFKTEIPVIGFGVFRIPDGEEVVNAVKWALEAGYRHIDTAMIYKNEEGVGKAIRESGIPREEIFVTTKLWNTDQGYDNALKAIDVSLSKLELSYVDLYLVHWPTAGDHAKGESINKRQETWRAMEEICKLGKARAIGVSNYTITHLEEMKKYVKIPPAINQVEFHPFLYQEELLNYCQQNNITFEAHSPLILGEKLDNEIINSIAKKYGKTSAQIFIISL